MYLFSGVTIEGEDSASSRQRSTLAVMPSTVRSARIRLTLASSRIDSSTLRAISRRVTLSSKLQVVGDLHQADGDGLQLAGRLDEGVAGALRLEVVAGLRQRQVHVGGELVDDGGGE